MRAEDGRLAEQRCAAPDKGSVPTASSIGEWGKRVSDARARLTGEMLVSLGRSRMVREDSEVLAELTLAFEELQVAEEELRAQTEELAASRELLDAERARYRALFERAPVPYLVTDTTGNIGDANDAAARLLRVSRDRLHGKPLAVFVPPSRRRAFRTRFSP
jgi:PAS domain-containing protein